MKKVMRTEQETLLDIQSGGVSFLGYYIGDLLSRIEELDDKVTKQNLIDEYFLNQHCFSDKKENGTRTRVNAAIRIIKSEKVIYVLKQVINSDYRVQKESKQKAMQTLEMLESGQMKLPTLN